LTINEHTHSQRNDTPDEQQKDASPSRSRHRKPRPRPLYNKASHPVYAAEAADVDT